MSRVFFMVFAVFLLISGAQAQGIREPGDLVTAPGGIVRGNPDGDVTIIEVFDYQCPACRASHPALKEIVAQDAGVRVIYRDWPVFGPASEEAARLAIAAEAQGKHADVHDAFMGLTGRLSIEAVRAAARGAGLDMPQAEAFLETEARAVAEHLGTNRLIADQLGLRGTPTFFIGHFVVFGGVSVDDLQEFIADVRAGRDKSAE